jgi:hypothetical protein
MENVPINLPSKMPTLFANNQQKGQIKMTASTSKVCEYSHFMELMVGIELTFSCR